MPLWSGSRKTSSPYCVGLSLHASGFACCVVDRAANALVSAYFHTQPDNAAFGDTLARWVHDSGHKGSHCYVSLGPDDYKLISAETPAVPEEEINQALLWSLREIIDSKPEDSVVASFAQASGIHRSGKPLRQIVAARKNRIRAIVDAVLGAGLELEGIEIPELSHRNLIARLTENGPGAGLVSQNSRGVSVSLYRGGELYVTRHLAGIANLADAAHPLTAPRLVEQLGLELLRTLDYYDSQLHQRPPAAIFLQPLPTETRLLLDGLSTTINVQAKQLRFADLIADADKTPLETLEHCFTALGCALYDDTAAQRINLYTDEFRPRRQWLTPQRCLHAWGGMLACGLVIAVVQGWHNHALRSDVNKLELQTGSEQTELDTDKTTLAQRSPSPELGAELDRDNAEAAAKNALLDALRSGVLSGEHGYTPVLSGLSRNTMEGLWLTEIEIEKSDVNLTGVTRKADYVPAYIEKIVGDAGFGPREYRSLKLQSTDKELLTFELRGHRETTDK